MAFDPLVQSQLSLVTLARLCQAGKWRLSLAHDRGHHLLIWITRGQGLALIDGAQRGIGAHNALFIPAHHLMAVDPGRQGFGQALLIPPATALTWPATPRHLRVVGAAAQAEMNRLTEALGREYDSARPLGESAVRAYGELVSIWLRRQMQQTPSGAARDSAARRLSRRWCARVVGHFANPGDMKAHAAALGVTPTHLARVCRAETGRTAAGLLSQRRLHAARQLLSDTDVPVADIARHLGFASAAGFTRFVTTHTARPPSALRRNSRNPD